MIDFGVIQSKWSGLTYKQLVSKTLKSLSIEPTQKNVKQFQLKFLMLFNGFYTISSDLNFSPQISM